MSTVLALPLLYEAVKARMDADAAAQGAIPTPHRFGWRTPEERLQTPAGTWRRVLWVPGDDGDVGQIGAPRQPGRNPRPVATLRELFTVYLEAADTSGASAAAKASQTEDELAQYTAARLLLDAWYRAAEGHCGHQLGVSSVEWVTDKKTRRFGATIRIVCTLEAMIPDVPLAEVGGQSDTPARAAGVTELLDAEETDETAPAYPAARAASFAQITRAGEQTVDGVALVAGDRVLLAGQLNPVEDGLYVVALGAWSRTDDVLEHGTHVYVEPGGALNGSAGFRLDTADPITVGVTELTFIRVSPPEDP